MGRMERVDLKATATLFSRRGSLGRFVVQDLSPSGALLTGAHDVRRSAPLHLYLELPSGEALTVGAHVKRRAISGDLVALAVGFLHHSSSSEDRIQDAILELLDQRYRAEHPAVLVVDRSSEKRARLAERVGALGRRVLTAEAPLSAMRILDEPSEHVDALVVREPDDTGIELLRFVADSYPSVRPLLFVEDKTADPPVLHPRVARCGPEHLADQLRASA